MNDLNVLKPVHPSAAARARILAVACALVASSAAAEPLDWNQWRGPSRDGSVAGADWPDSLDGLDRTWRVEVGEGYPGPIVVDDKVFVVASLGDTEEVVLALDRASGREVWRTAWQGAGKVPFFAKKNGEWVRSTPAHDGSALYVGGMEEVLIKLDAETGRELWAVDFPARFGTQVPDFGFASSPLLAEGALYVQAANSLVKLDPASGRTLWRALESPADMSSSGAFSSPVMATLRGRMQLVVQTRSTLYGLDPDNGGVLWSHDVPNFRGMNILTPIVHRDTVLTSTYRNRTFLFRVASEGESLVAREQWTSKVHGYMSSPVVIDGHAYLHLGNGRLACIDLATGAERWISKPFGDYWSMITQGDKLLALDAGGELHLLRANTSELELLASRRVAKQSTWGHLAISGDEIFVRELNAIAAYRWIEPAGGG